jgi:hypothetical protein
VYHYAAQVQKAPFIFGFRPSGAVEYIQTLVPGIFFYMPFQTGKVNGAGNGGDYKKIRPKIKIPHVHYHYFSAVRAGEEPSKFYRFPGARKPLSGCVVSL